MSTDFAQIAVYLKEPLALVGYVITLAFLLAKRVIREKILRALGAGRGAGLIRLLVHYGFAVGIVIVLLAFGLKYIELIDERTPSDVVRRTQDDATRLRTRAIDVGAPKLFPKDWPATDQVYSSAMSSLNEGKKTTAYRIFQRSVVEYQRMIDGAEQAAEMPSKIVAMRLVVKTAQDGCENHVKSGKSRALRQQGDQLREDAEHLERESDLVGAFNKMQQAHSAYLDCYLSGDFSPPEWMRE